METIIHQITIELIDTINNKAFSNEISDLDKLAAEIFEDCAEYARLMLQEVIRIRNSQLREDKQIRRQKGFVLKEKDRPRQILTKLGTIEWKRDYYYDKNKKEYVFPLDYLLGIRSYERIGNEVVADLLNRAAEVSYAKSADIVTGGAVTRQSVRNHLLKANIPEKQPENEHKEVKELHVYADEDHVHMQKPGKSKGKMNQIVPLVTVTEGIKPVNRSRNKTIEPMHFVDENQSPKELWKSVEGYIFKAYDTTHLDKIYIHADGGKWITNGLEGFTNVVHVMDGYHFYKSLHTISKRYPNRNVRIVIINSLKENNRKKVDLLLQELSMEDDKIQEFGRYLLGNWEAIRNLVILNIPGSCTEGQVSHVLSERFSRNPMGWSKAGLGKLTKLRIYCCNGGRLTGENIKQGIDYEKFSKYADRFINESIKGTYDWTIFNSESFIMDKASGTQIALKHFGTNHCITEGKLWS
jgi:hypothetical protein